MRDLSIFDNAIEITPARKKQSYTPATIAVRKMHGKWYSRIVLRADLAVWVFQHTHYRIKLAGPSKNLILLIPDSTGRYKPGNKNGAANINLLQVEGWPQAETTFGANYEIVKGSLYLELPENWQDKVNQKHVEPDIPTLVKVLSTPATPFKTEEDYRAEHPLFTPPIIQPIFETGILIPPTPNPVSIQPDLAKLTLNTIKNRVSKIEEGKLTLTSTSDGKVDAFEGKAQHINPTVIPNPTIEHIKIGVTVEPCSFYPTPEKNRDINPMPVLEKPIIPVVTKPAPILTKTVNPLTKPVKQIPITTTAIGLENIVNSLNTSSVPKPNNPSVPKPRVGPNGKVLVPLTEEEKEERRKNSKGPTMVRPHVLAAEEQARASRTSKSSAMRFADFRRKKDD